MKVSSFWMFFLLFLFQFAPLVKAQTKSGEVLYNTQYEPKVLEKLSERIPFSITDQNLIGYLDLSSNKPLDYSDYLYVHYALKYFKKKKVIFILANLNMAKADLFPASKIAALLQKLDVNEGISTVAYLNDHVKGAAVLLPFAARFIVSNQTSSLGPLANDEGDNGFKEEGKLLSMSANELKELGSFYSRDPLLLQAFSNPGLLVVERQGKLITLESESQIISLGQSPDKVLKHHDELLQLTAPELLQYRLSDFQLNLESKAPLEFHSKRTPFSEMALSKQEYFAKIPSAYLVKLSSWRFALLSFLIQPYISAVFLLILILCFYIEVHRSGFKVFGWIGVACLVFILCLSVILQSVTYYSLIFLALGIGLLLVDIFLIPGFGGMGILGIVLTIMSLFSLLIPGILRFSILDFNALAEVSPSVVSRLVWLSCSVALAVLGIVIIKKFFSKKLRSIDDLLVDKRKLGERNFLEEVEEKQLPEVGKTGVAHCTIRAHGKILVDDVIYDAVAQNIDDPIHKSDKAVIVAHDNGNLVVKKVDEAN